MKTYKGVRNEHSELIVTVNGVSLNPRLDLWNHCSDGFECGHGGVGAAQLALAILADHLADDKQALALCQHFKWATIAKLPRRGNWQLDSDQIQHALLSK